jgi:hypothetical protein
MDDQHLRSKVLVAKHDDSCRSNHVFDGGLAHSHSTFRAALALAQHRSVKKGLVVLTFNELKKFNLPLNKFTSIHFLDDVENKGEMFDKVELNIFLNSIKPHIKNFKYFLK